MLGCTVRRIFVLLLLEYCPFSVGVYRGSLVVDMSWSCKVYALLISTYLVL